MQIYIYHNENEKIVCKTYKELVDILVEFSEIDDFSEWVEGCYSGLELYNRLEDYLVDYPNATLQQFQLDLIDGYYEGMEIAVEECYNDGVITIEEVEEER